MKAFIKSRKYGYKDLEILSNIYEQILVNLLWNPVYKTIE